MLDKFKKELVNKREIYLRIKVNSSAGKAQVKEVMSDNTVKIDVAKPPIRGKANQELVKFLAREFKVSKENVKIISGARERIKLIRINK